MTTVTEYWTSLRLRFTVTGPGGERLWETAKPYAILGVAPNGEVVFDGDPSKASAAAPFCLIVACDAGIFTAMLRKDEPACPYELSDGDALSVGQSQLRVQRIGKSDPPPPFPLTLGYIAFFKDRKQIGARRVLGPLTVVGRERPSKWRFKSNRLEPCHMGIYSDGERAWAISLHQDNRVWMFNQPVETCELDWDHLARFGNYRVLYISNANALRIDEKRELSDRDMHGPGTKGLQDPMLLGALDESLAPGSLTTEELALSEPLLSGGLEYDALVDPEGSAIDLSSPAVSGTIDGLSDVSAAEPSSVLSSRLDEQEFRSSLAKLEGQLVELHERIEQQHTAQPSGPHPELEDLRASVESLRSDLQSRQSHDQTAADRQKQFDEATESLQQQVSGLRTELEQLGQASVDLRKAAMEELAATMRGETSQLREELARLSESTQSESDARGAAEALQTEFAGLKEQLSSLQEQTRRDESTAQAAVNAEIASLRETLTSLQSEQRHVPDIERMSEATAAANAEVSALREQMAQLQAEAKEREAASDKQMSALRELVLDLRAQLEERASLDNVSQERESTSQAVLATIQGQVTAFQEQLETFQQWQTQQEEKQTESIEPSLQQTLERIAGLEANMQTYKSQLTATERDLGRLDQLQEEIAALKQQWVDLQSDRHQQAADQREQLDEYSKASVQNQQDIAGLQAEFKALKEQSEQWQREHAAHVANQRQVGESLQEALANVRADIATLTDQGTNNQTNRDEAAAAIAEEVTDLQERLTELQCELSRNSEEEEATPTKDLAELREVLGNVQSELAKLRETQQETSQGCETLVEDMLALQDQVNDRVKTGEVIVDGYSTHELVVTRAEFEVLQARLSALEIDIDGDAEASFAHAEMVLEQASDGEPTATRVERSTTLTTARPTHSTARPVGMMDALETATASADEIPEFDSADAALRTMEVLQRQNEQRRSVLAKAAMSWTIALWVVGIAGFCSLIAAIVWRYMN